MDSCVGSDTRWARVVQLRGDAHADLLRYLIRKVPGPDADDMAQECYIRIQRCENLLTLQNPKAFLFRIAANLLTDRARRRMRQYRCETLLSNAAGLDESGDAPSHEPAMEDSMVAAESLRAVVEAIALLPPKCRQAFLMQRLDEASHDEIARTIGVSRSMVEKYIAKALAALHAVLP